jgi:MEMO1 family protein
MDPCQTGMEQAMGVRNGVAARVAIMMMIGMAGCSRGEEGGGTDSAPAVRAPEWRGRPAAVAGSFYPGHAATLRAAVTDMVRTAAGGAVEGKLVGAVAPHAGYVFSGRCAASVYGRLAKGAYRRVIVVAPSHYKGYRGVAVPGAEIGYYETPLGRVPIDRVACGALASLPGFVVDDDLCGREHSLEVHLPFLQVALGDFELIPLVCGAVSPAEVAAVGEALSALLDGGTLIIASSDFTHYGPNFNYVPFRTDVRETLYAWMQQAAGSIAALDLDAFRLHQRETRDTICGRVPIEIVMDALRRLPRPPAGRVLDLYTSGDRTGDFENSVSYAAIGFFETGPKAKKGEGGVKERKSGAWTSGLTVEEMRTLLALARDTLEWAVRGGRGAFDFSRYAVTDALRVDRATFVTLKIRGQLRGCIGSLVPVEPLYMSIHHNAIQSALRDTRFRPVTPAELPLIHVDLSVLSPIRDIDSPDLFVVGEQGIIMEKGMHRAVYLPEVAPEQGWSRDETLASLGQKAGLGPDDWRRGARFKVFESVLIAEE